MTNQNLELYNEIRKLVKRANQRLVRLERNFGTNTWASKKLRNKLDINKLNAWTSSNRIRFNKNMSKMQLDSIKKATEQFLNSKTSTVKGVKETKQKQIKGLQRVLQTDDFKLSYQEAETLEEFFAENYAKDILAYIPGSEIVALAIESKSVPQYKRRKYFFEQIETYYLEGNDLDMKRKLGKFYRKYIKS